MSVALVPPSGLTVATLSVPAVEEDADTFAAASAYAGAGWYLVPLKRGSKHPGSRLGEHWQRQSSRDPQVLAAWFAGTSDGIALHAGRSGAVIFDVDRPDRLHPALAAAITSARPPQQSTRLDVPGRGHFLFAQPPGRDLGNGVGALGGAWGEVRGKNGVVVVAPSVHEKVREGGRYRWVSTGTVPVLPETLAVLLHDASPSLDAATDAAVEAFLDQHTACTRPELLPGWVTTFNDKVSRGESRHARMVSVLAGAMAEAAAGLIAARPAAEHLRQAFLAAVGRPATGSEQGAARTGAVAQSEWAGILAWAVAQAAAVDPAVTRARVAERMPPGGAVRAILGSSPRGQLYPASAPPPPGRDGVVPGSEAVPSTAEPDAAQDEDAEWMPEVTRRIVVTPASSVRMRVTQWTWQARIPLGALSLIGGREGIGKSLTLVDLCARLTRGTLPGAHLGDPRPVLYVAAEDSWAHTIAPRLVAAGADLDHVYRVDVLAEGLPASLVLPLDAEALRAQIHQLGAALVAVDPLVSVLDGRIDTHRDNETRRALEPLVQVADATGAAVVGLVHHGKAQTTDALSLVLGSRAFTAVSRSVLAAVRDPEAEDSSAVLALVKNNLGRLDLPALRYRVESASVPTPDGPTEVGRLVWLGEEDVDLAGMIRSGRDPGDAEDSADRDDASRWLRAYLGERGGEAEAKEIKAAARVVDIAERTLHRARSRAGVKIERSGFPARSVWKLTPVVPPVVPVVPEPVPWHDRHNTGTTGSVEPHLPPVGCALCGEPLDVVEPGQTVHPGCAP